MERQGLQFPEKDCVLLLLHASVLVLAVYRRRSQLWDSCEDASFNAVHADRASIARMPTEAERVQTIQCLIIV